MKRWLYFFIVLFCCACQARLSETNAAFISTERFPQDWVGEYAGTLEILRGGSHIAQEIPMGLVIASTDEDSVFTWQIIYGEDKTTGLRLVVLLVLVSGCGCGCGVAMGAATDAAVIFFFSFSLELSLSN